jgi:predicted Rossmann fold flavoprotein
MAAAELNKSSKVLVVIGGGAAGFFCAVNAARIHPSLKVIIIEKSNKLLSKVRISGGGRCNVTHALFDMSEMSRRYPRGQHFVKKTFHQFFTSDTVQWFEERGVEIKAEKDGRMFPVSDSSESIIHCLLKEAGKYKVEIRMQSEVKQVVPSDTGFKLLLAGNEDMQADFLCIACGGFPKASMFDWLTAIGHSFSEPVPSLFTFNLPKNPISELMGVSVDNVRIKIEGTKLSEEGPVLITHWGLSGPAVLKLSAWGARELAMKYYHFKVHINWMPAVTEQELHDAFKDARQSNPSKKVVNHNLFYLPARLWQFFLAAGGISQDLRFSDLPSRAENLMVKNINDYIVEVKGKTTYKEEFVTEGGISLS